MRFYADVLETRSYLDILDELHGLALRLAEPSSRIIPGKALGLARDGLILSGMLEQALADDPKLGSAIAQSPAGGMHSAMVLTDWWADRLVAPDAALPTTPPPCAGPNVPLNVVVPEGYLFYALFPEWYGRIGRTMAVEAGETQYVVVGVRSIGTSLSAAMSAGLRSAGCSVRRYTVRPAGDPFSREVVIASDILAAWRAVADRGARFVAVDEGPGLSGSSLAALVQAFQRAGVSRRRITMICANPPGSLPRARPEIRAIWQSIPFLAVGPAGEHMLSRCLAGLLSAGCNSTLSLDRDLSWGGWREKAAPALPLFERRKFLLRDQAGDQVVAKFVGFAGWGARKAACTRQIAERGMAPPFRGYAHGFLMQDWVGEALPDRFTDRGRREVHEAAATYYAELRRSAPPSNESVDLVGLATTVEDIRDAWFGVGNPGQLGSMRQAAAAAAPRALDGDQRPEPIEWRRWGNRIVKCDTADHYLDHSWARRMDIAFDLAGFMDEWHMNPVERDRFISAYMRESGDTGAVYRLPFFRCVYQAHRLAMLDTAYHAGMDDGEGSITRKRQAVAEYLAIALAAPWAVPCA